MVIDDNGLNTICTVLKLYNHI